MMLRNYLKISIRTFIKERFYALINISGLALGIASSLLIGLYILHETSYDQTHPDVENTYRVNMTAIWNPEGGIMGSSVIPLAESLQSEFPSVTSTLRINTPGTQQVNVVNALGEVQAYNEDNVLAVDSTFFEFFDIPLIEGDPNTALNKKNSIVLTKSQAKTYFGDQPVLGKTILLGEDRVATTVTGVSIDPPSNMHFDYDILMSMHTNPMIKRFEWSWIWTQVVTYIKTNGDPSIIQGQMPQIAPKYAVSAFQRLGIDFDKYQEEKGGINFYLQPIEDIHLYSGEIHNRIGASSDIKYIYIFGTIAGFILLLACINFMNLTTARASGRAKEIGVKKALGSHRSQLINQFLTEAILMTTIAMVLALGLVELLKIWLIDVLGVAIGMSMFSNPIMLCSILLLPIVLGILAGSYPAFYLTAFKPTDVLKGKLQSGMKNAGLRNVLVVCQFSIAITLMACTLIAFQQLEYFRNGNLGYDKEHIMVIHGVDKLDNQLESYHQQLTQYANVSSSAIATVMPNIGLEDMFYHLNNPEKKVSIGTVKVDEQYLPTMGIELVVGRNFSKDHLSDKSGIIINETAMRSFGLSIENVIGQQIEYYGSQTYEVIGVMKDFHNHSLQYNITPVGFFHIDSKMFWGDRLIAVKFKPENLQSLITNLEKDWKAITDTAPFTYTFFDEDLARNYESEQQIGQLFGVFTTLALIIACIGLFGLASYVSTQRGKEIGIRKVLGASTNGLVILLNKDFTKLVAISLLIALPVSLWAMNKWLEQFANKINIGWEVFAMIAIASLLLAWGTVAFHSIKTAMLNPAKILKDE